MRRSRAEARQLILRRLLQEQPVAGQEALVEALAQRGHRVTQTTVSRDLQSLGAVKVGGPEGERYELPPEVSSSFSSAQLAQMLKAFVVAIDSSLNLAVLRTSPGAANPVAAAIDGARLDSVLATVAGDDTVLVVAREGDGGATVARQMEEILEF